MTRSALSPVRSAAARPRTGGTCVVVPMFNEAAVVSDVVAALADSFDAVVCVDDGSSDESGRLAAEAGATVVYHPVNLGQGAALQTGVEFALRSSADYLITFDADGQHRIEDAVKLLERARAGDVDIVLGSRFLEEGNAVPRVRRAVLRAAVLFTRATTGLSLTDTHNGLRVMTRATAELMKLRLHGMAHASEILGVVARHQLAYVELPVSVVYTDYSRRKGQSSVNALNVLVDLLLARLRFTQ
jgi:glycosyltransferase involved in cell wall biosynthesis